MEGKASNENVKTYFAPVSYRSSSILFKIKRSAGSQSTE